MAAGILPLTTRHCSENQWRVTMFRYLVSVELPNHDRRFEAITRITSLSSRQVWGTIGVYKRRYPDWQSVDVSPVEESEYLRLRAAHII